MITEADKRSGMKRLIKDIMPGLKMRKIFKMHVKYPNKVKFDAENLQYRFVTLEYKFYPPMRVMYKLKFQFINTDPYALT
mgnify:CR=1 FL=1